MQPGCHGLLRTVWEGDIDKIDEAQLKRLQHEHAAAIRQFWDQNRDFPERLRLASVSALYDADDDFLEITLDGPREAVSYGIHNTLYLRADFDTLKIFGVELEHFRQHAAENSIEFRFCWNVLLLAGNAQLTVRSNADQARVAAWEQTVRELVATV